MTSKDKDNRIPLHGFFWYALPDIPTNFHQQTYDFMRESGVLSEEGGKILLDLDRYDDAIFNQLEQLQAIADIAATTLDVTKYCWAAEDLLRERVEFLANLRIITAIAQEANQNIESASRLIEDNNDILKGTIPSLKKIYDHFLKAHELMNNFAIKRIESKKNDKSNEGNKQ